MIAIINNVDFSEIMTSGTRHARFLLCVGLLRRLVMIVCDDRSESRTGGPDARPESVFHLESPRNEGLSMQERGPGCSHDHNRNFMPFVICRI